MTDKLLSAEELENALFVLDGDASHESDVGHAGRVVRSHISALTSQLEVLRAGLEVIERGYEAGETFSGTHCAEIARGTLRDAGLSRAPDAEDKA